MFNKEKITINLATDHAGFSHKEKVRKILEEKNFKVYDFGAFENNPDDDYPDFISPLASKISENSEENIGIIFGGSGQGEAMCANRFKNVRAVIFYGNFEEKKEILELSRKHNNANILSIGARFVAEGDLEKILNFWLETKFEGGRHLRRIEKF